MKYLNTKYASDARCVGSIPNDKNSETTTTVDDTRWDEEYQGIIKNTDNNYVTDDEQMTALGINVSSDNKEYWMASRNNVNQTAQNHAKMRVGPNAGSWYGTSILTSKANANISSTNYYDVSATATYGLRPVFTLNANIKITGRNGTKEDPYTLN